MTIFGFSVAAALALVLAIAFFGAGAFNLAGGASVKAGFVRWGYPEWWNLVTGGLELLAALLIAIPSTRLIGLLLGAAILLAAVATVLRHRDYGHLPPGLVLTTLAALDVALTVF